MIASSLVFVGTLWGLRTGVLAVGTESALIYSSCAAMMVRIGYAFNHARRTIGNCGGTCTVTDVVPKRTTIGMFTICGVVMRSLSRSERWRGSWKGWIELVGAGGAMGLGMLVIMSVKRMISYFAHHNLAGERNGRTFNV
jgi:oligosaccharide translocation protein RFT1